MNNRYRTEHIRALLTEGFTDEDLRILCYDEPEFKNVYYDLVGGNSKTQIVHKLVEYADQQKMLDLLLELAKKRNPAKYEEHQPYIRDISTGLISPLEKTDGPNGKDGVGQGFPTGWLITGGIAALVLIGIAVTLLMRGNGPSTPPIASTKETIVEKATVSSSPTPSSKVSNDAYLYDDFNDPEYDGRFNPGKWSFAWGNQNPQRVFQREGRLAVTQTESDEMDNTDLAPIGYDGVSINKLTQKTPTFFEADLRLDPDQKFGLVDLKLTVEPLPDKEQWLTGCRIDDIGRADCMSGFKDEKPHFFPDEDASWSIFPLGTWHKFRIEIDPDTMIFTYYLDGQKIGSEKAPVEVKGFDQALYRLSVGVWGPIPQTTVTGYIDNFRFGPIEE